ncbi:MAG TPA: YCF48-related protein [Candidatus Eisenbacteria bacterium]
MHLGTDARFSGIWFTDSLNGWIAGGAREVAGGMLGRTRDGGRTWRIESGIVPGTAAGLGLNGIVFRDTARGCVVTSDGSIHSSSDGGRSWRATRTGRSPGDGLAHLQLLGELDGWAIGPASIVGTRDGGETWTVRARNTLETGYLSGNAVAFTDDSHGWLVRHAGVLMRTYDGGTTWTRVGLTLPPGAAPTLWDVTFVNADQGWLVGDEGTIFHTSNGGESWQRQIEGVPVERVLARGERPRPPDIVPGLDGGPSRLSLTAVRFADPERGFALGSYADAGESVVLGTRNGGETWRTEHVAPGQHLHALFVLDRMHAWAVGDRVRERPQVLVRYRGTP